MGRTMQLKWTHLTQHLRRRWKNYVLVKNQIIQTRSWHSCSSGV